ncbi:hypothetical protein ACOMHN_043765 [Nucella lapillus]
MVSYLFLLCKSRFRQGHPSYPPFGVPGMASGSYPPSNDYTYYSKFSTASQRMKKQLTQRCTWKCTALLLLIMCVALLACTVYFAAIRFAIRPVAQGEAPFRCVRKAVELIGHISE